MLRIDIPTLAEFKALAAIKGDTCVSLYVPTEPQAVQGTPIRPGAVRKLARLFHSGPVSRHAFAPSFGQRWLPARPCSPPFRPRPPRPACLLPGCVPEKRLPQEMPVLPSSAERVILDHLTSDSKGALANLRNVHADVYIWDTEAPRGAFEIIELLITVDTPEEHMRILEKLFPYLHAFKQIPVRFSRTPGREVEARPAVSASAARGLKFNS